MAATLGARIRERRQQLNLTLRDLAEQVGVTSSFLSYVERQVVTPSLTSLARIAHELRVPLAYFFVDDGAASQVVRAGKRPSLRFADANVSYELLTRYPGQRLACIVVHLEPGTSSFDEPQQHAQEECVLMMSGALLVELGEERFILNEGDSIHYDGLLPHRFTAAGEEVAVYLMVISPLTV
jgi:transcriptional regulator with XRE-family HTH domain